jgi:hypothetical protein
VSSLTQKPGIKDRIPSVEKLGSKSKILSRPPLRGPPTGHFKKLLADRNQLIWVEINLLPPVTTGGESTCTLGLPSFDGGPHFLSAAGPLFNLQSCYGRHIALPANICMLQHIA